MTPGPGENPAAVDNLIGMAAAAVAGFFALKLMLRVISKNNYKWFALYLVLLSVFTFVNYYFTFWFG